MKTIDQELRILKKEFRPNFSKKEDVELFKDMSMITFLENSLVGRENIFLGTILIRKKINLLKHRILTRLIYKFRM